MLPGTISAFAIWRHRLSLLEIGALLLGIAGACALSTIHEFEGGTELHATPVFTYALIIGAGLRWYLPPLWKSFALCWVVLVASDFIVMHLSADVVEGVRLPVGIGGAGFGDALFVEPLVLVAGLLALQYARYRQRLRRQATANTPHTQLALIDTPLLRYVQK